MGHIGKRALLCASIALVACGGSNSSNPPTNNQPGTNPPPGQDQPVAPDQLTELNLDACDPLAQSFVATIDNQYLPMPVGRRLILTGDDDGEQVRLEVDVLDKTRPVGGVITRAVAETEYQNGELFERTTNYFAQTSQGTVCYFGEDVEFFENGEVVNTNGSWLAEGPNKPGIQMPTNPSINTQFYQEFAPGIAEDKSAIQALNGTSDTPFRSFDGVLTALDWNPLEGQSIDDGETKQYANGVGLIRDDKLALSDYREQITELPLLACDPRQTTFSLTIDNPYFPLPVGRQLVLEGEDDGEQIRLELDVLDQTETVAGVLTRVVTETEFKDGQLFERTFNYFAQAAGGEVCYFGEDVEFYENGVIVDRRGSWRANGAEIRPGIQMPATPALNTWFYQEDAPGQAEDKSLIASLSETVGTPVGDFDNALIANDWNPLDGDSFLDSEEKAFAPGVGLIQDAAIRLTRYSP